MIERAYAHEEETHETVVESTFHFIETFNSPYFAIPAFFATLIIIYVLLNKFTPLHRGAKLLIMLGCLFVGAIIGFLYVPPLGVVTIVLGFGFAGMLALAGIKQ